MDVGRTLRGGVHDSVLPTHSRLVSDCPAHTRTAADLASARSHAPALSQPLPARLPRSRPHLGPRYACTRAACSCPSNSELYLRR